MTCNPYFTPLTLDSSVLSCLSVTNWECIWWLVAHVRTGNNKWVWYQSKGLWEINKVSSHTQGTRSVFNPGNRQRWSCFKSKWSNWKTGGGIKWNWRGFQVEGRAGGSAFIHHNLFLSQVFGQDEWIQDEKVDTRIQTKATLDSFAVQNNFICSYF